MALHASDCIPTQLRRVFRLLSPIPGRLEYSVRLAVMCALTTLVAEVYQTPDVALTAYITFFVIRSDRTSSIISSITMALAVTVIVGTVLLITMAVIDDPLWRVAAMAVWSFCLLFAASASKLQRLAGTIALIVAYALDMLGTAQIGEIATRGLLYAWLFVGIPAGVCIAVNLASGPAPRRLVERALARRLRAGAAMLRAPKRDVRDAFTECLHEGLGEIPAWLKMARLERTSSGHDIAALEQAARSTAVLVSLVDAIARDPEQLLPGRDREQLALVLEEMAGIFLSGGYPTDITFDAAVTDLALSPSAQAITAELQDVLHDFARIPPPDPSQQRAPKAAGGFFLPDAFTNSAHVEYALKTTAAAMFCYVAYSLLDWPGIHTCFITCYIVSLGTAAETFEKITLRIIGCLIGAAAGLLAIVFLVPDMTSITALLSTILVVALVSAWIAAGTPRISYVGFQIVFAFLLCVVQGPAPKFDLSIARDRTIGIIFGNLVVGLIFTHFRPVSVSKRIDPAIAALLQKLAALAATASRARRWALVSEAQTAAGAIAQDLDLADYEPASMRPSRGWTEHRRGIVDAIIALQGPTLLAVDRDSGEAGDLQLRIDRLASDFPAEHQLPRPSRGQPDALGSRQTPTRDMPASTPQGFLEAPLSCLERVVLSSTPGRDGGSIGAVAKGLGAVLLSLWLAGCATSTIEMAPDRPDRPWVPATTPDGELAPGRTAAGTSHGYVLPANPALAAMPPAAVVATKTYSLADLIDLAESSNPTTRVAWNDARRAALAAGIAESAYLPRITASALTGFQRGNASNSALGLNLANNASLNGTVSAISLEWLLFDFGQREAVVDAAKQTSLISNIFFTAAHQQVIYSVSVAFYAHAAARARLKTATQSLANAQAVQAAAEARYNHDIGTVTEVAQARQGTAQAKLALVQATGGAQDAYLTMISAVGISPTTKIAVADVSGRRLSPAMSKSVEAIIAESLSRRPDVQSAYAGWKASLAGVRAARAEFLPKFFLSSIGSHSSGSLNVTALPSVGEQLPTVNVTGSQDAISVFGNVTVPLYDGGTRAAALERARDEADSAEARLTHVRQDAVRQVAVADNALRTSLSAHAASRVLTEAAQTTFDAALASYRSGTGSITDVILAQTQLLQARNASTDAYSTALSAAATLALSTGALGEVPR